MALENQIFCYSVDTDYFFTSNEDKIYRRIWKLNKYKKKLNIILLDFKKDIVLFPKNKYYNTYIFLVLIIIKARLTKLNKKIATTKQNLIIEFSKNKETRRINERKIFNKDVVAIFESTLTRTLKIKTNTLTKDIIIVHTYYFDIIKDIVINGFYYNEEKYVFLTASAGQIRTKKTVFVKESTLNIYKKSLMCGLTVEKINKLGGVNVNKYLAYLALCNSATEIWYNFNISKTIVVDDMETNVRGIVDFINHETYKITRKKMDVPINHTDGCGMILPSASSKSFMVRMPWIKGLLVPFDYITFIKQNKTSSKVNDIYGKEWDIINDGIDVILTKSQFKMYKYYTSWSDYCNNFIENNCQASKCNEEGSNTNDAKINYQMLQTLVDIKEEELDKIVSKTKNKLDNLCKNEETMKTVLGVTPRNKHKNYIQQAIEIYPNILRDSYSKKILKDLKNKIVKEGKSGRIDIEGKYAFICPDLYAFCEYLFLKDKNPKGLLENGEVFCRIYKDSNKLDCLRSPHLYREHAIRKNIVNNRNSNWFITDGLYTSCHDLISKILQFDVDGDASLVVADETIISVAERNMKNIVPLFYKMKNAPVIEIDNTIIYNGLNEAYSGGNIGIYSNNISKIWNSEDLDLDIIKLLTCENNFQIDYAKTLYKLERPEWINEKILKYVRKKVPYFFMFAKDKEESNVEAVNNSTVNRIGIKIGNPPFKFNSANIGKFDYNILKANNTITIDENIIKTYNDLNLKKIFMMNSEKDYNENRYTYLIIREKILAVNTDIQYVVSVLVDYLYGVKKTNNKVTLWECFGDVLIYNIKNNIQTKYTHCLICNTLTEKTSNKTKYCEKCAKEVEKEQERKNTRERMRKFRNKNKNVTEIEKPQKPLI